MNLDSLELWKSAAEVAVFPMAITDNEDRILWTNSSWLSLLNYSEPEVIGKKWYLFGPEADISPAQKHLALLRAGVEQAYYRHRCLLKRDESPIDCAVYVHRYPFDNRPSEGTILIVSEREDSMALTTLRAEFERISRTMEALERRMADVEEHDRKNKHDRESNTTVSIGGDITGRDKQVNSTDVVKAVTAIGIAGIVIIVWILYYWHGGTQPPMPLPK